MTSSVRAACTALWDCCACVLVATFSKMAAYTKDDFVTGSDLSDISDDDFDINEVDFTSDCSEDDSHQYCVCGKPSTMEMIACDNDKCAIVWWHYECAGLSAETIPENCWICQQCQPANEQNAVPPASGSIKQQATNPPKKKSKDAHEERATEKQKATKKSKPTVQRPTSKFKESDATKKATSYFIGGLQAIQKHPVFLGPYPIAVCMMTLVTSLMTKTDMPEFDTFRQATVTGLWKVITSGDLRLLKPEGYDLMWSSFHEFRLATINTWSDLLRNLDLYSNGQHIYIVYQYLLQAVLQAMIEDRNATDKPTPPSETETEARSLSSAEEQVLRYVSGYIPFSLYKHFKKQVNETAKVYCKFVASWKVDCSKQVRNFLNYTKEWTEMQNRGGLFKVSDEVYLLFRAMELETSKYLTINNLKNFINLDVQSILMDNIRSNKRVQTYWCSLTEGKISGNVSSHLLDIVVRKWIKIRTKAFVNVYLNILKDSGRNVSKKGEKALRKDLSS